MINFSAFVDSVIETARQAGSYIRNESEKFNIKSVQHKGINDFVSYVDIEAEKLIVEKLKTLIPEAGFITEEETIRSVKKEYNWVIDPLDGTTNFIHGLPPYSVSIALTYNDEPMIGVIHEIKSGEVFSAVKSGGAFLNKRPISVSERPSLNESLIGTGFPYKDYTLLEPYLNSLKYFIENTQGVRRQGSAAVDLAHVACGRLDAFYEYMLNPWDVTAGILLIREAGGVVSDFKGNKTKLTGAEIVASNQLVYKEFLNTINNNFC